MLESIIQHNLSELNQFEEQIKKINVQLAQNNVSAEKKEILTSTLLQHSENIISLRCNIINDSYRLFITALEQKKQDQHEQSEFVTLKKQAFYYLIMMHHHAKLLPTFIQNDKNWFQDGTKGSVNDAIKALSHRNRFSTWRSESGAIIDTHLKLDVRVKDEEVLAENVIVQIKQECIDKYKSAMGSIEYSIADVTKLYITTRDPWGKDTIQRFPQRAQPRKTSNVGVLLKFARGISQRYFDLYEALVSIEIQDNIPMLPLDAGKLKNYKYNSEKIIAMHPSCQILVNGLLGLSKNKGMIFRNTLLEFMTNSKVFAENYVNQNDEKRKEAIEKILEGIIKSPDINLSEEVNRIKILFDAYNELPYKSDIDCAAYMMKVYGNKSYEEIFEQFSAVANMVACKASHDLRLIQELRHYEVVADSLNPDGMCYGALGTNPLVILNIIKNGDKNLEAEFRGLLYFCYRSSHFANSIANDLQKVQKINRWLQKNNKGWQLDPEFIAAMHVRGSQDVGPVFRYGAYGKLNKTFKLRGQLTEDEKKKFIRDHQEHLQTIGEHASNKTDKNARYYGTVLSDREKFIQTGEHPALGDEEKCKWIDKQKLKFDGWQEFSINKENNPTEQGRAYYSQVEALSLNVIHGPSGTLDQAIAMAGLVGYGVHEDLAIREDELQTIKLAYLSFMLPPLYHTSHEILLAAKTYGLKYTPGKNWEEYIYPSDRDFFINALSQAQKERGHDIPSYYLHRPKGR